MIQGLVAFCQGTALSPFSNSYLIILMVPETYKSHEILIKKNFLMQRTMLKCPIVHAHCTSIQNPEKEQKGSVSFYAVSDAPL